MRPSTVSHRVEFLRHPHPGHPHLRAWGIRIDGTDMRVLVAEATRALWDQELDEDDYTRQERDEFILGQHAPLHLDDDADGTRARAHFLGDAQPALRDHHTGAMCLLGCPCGIDACWPLLAMVRATATEVVWSRFHQPARPEWGELPLGPYVFPRPAYEATLAAPTPLTEDPLAALLGEG
ncbi:hypothetical protein F8R89_17515 [Streptomyces sp. SS1-1]|uniref:hypothetical protein n=1 Tax=Streptomyces sp. SS1-1 TaxID=2651869 RepID=UPI001250523C|nr:hypothetical protein [Streptomyces sp. SS1-1]KAB2973640.1 hypothetical protein F8R89_17515 [Streptomyces sp. SS1-1]